MTLLDRAMLRWALGKWIGVLVIGTFLVLLGEFIAKLGDYVRVLAGSQWWLLPLYFLVRIPDFLATWLPLATLVAAMFVIAPMHKQGTLVALSAAGVAPRRVFRVFIALALAGCSLSYLLADQILPRLLPWEERIQAALVGKRALDQDRVRPAGWTGDGTYWSAGAALPGAGTFQRVAIFRQDGSRRMAHADFLRWTPEGWRLEGVVLADGDRATALAITTPAAIGLPLPQDLDTLREQLRPDSARTTAELLSASHPRALRILAWRATVALLPLLCLLYGLPRFLCWIDRGRPAVTAMHALLWAVIPLAAAGILSRLLVSAGAQPLLLAGGVLGAVLSLGWFRWIRMRL
jgi:lipopolysaccharide export LptBFGC system permease protein LptF